jgi:hypothetical protein
MSQLITNSSNAFDSLGYRGKVPRGRVTLWLTLEVKATMVA